jgi:hypothetical protein
MRAHLLVLGALAACGGGRGMVDARWQVGDDDVEVSTEGKGGWCPSTSVILIEGIEGDRAVGVHWHYDSLAPGSFELEPPAGPDSAVTGASVGARYVHLDEVRGFRSLSGRLTVRAIDSSAVSGSLTAMLQRVGETDSTTLTMTFDRVPLVLDATLCVAPKAVPDSLAPKPATEP